MTTSIDMEIIEYSEKAIVVQGDDTRKYKDSLKTLGGKYNGRLRTGPGWVFPKNMKNKIENAINSEFKNVNTNNAHKSNIPIMSSKSSNLNTSNNKDLINMIIKLTNKVDNLENLIKKLYKQSTSSDIITYSSSNNTDDDDERFKIVKPKRLLIRKKND